MLLFSFTLNVVVAQEIPSETNRQYIQPAKLELTAAPGETVSKSIDVPVRVTLPDGTEYVEYETVTLSLIRQCHIKDLSRCASEICGIASDYQDV
jgi:hypothetical protein